MTCSALRPKGGTLRAVTTYAYLHGFGSGPNAPKAVALRRAFADRGLELAVPNLAVPSFAKLTLTAALGVIEALGEAAAARRERLALVGSSMGGLLGALYAERHPERVEALVLLCPGFDMAARFRTLVGERGLGRWQTQDRIVYPDADSKLTGIHYALYEDALTHPPFPAPPPGVPVTILHGRDDAVVPIEISRRYVQEHPEVMLHELADDHRLHGSLPEVIAHVCKAFALP